jgi:REP element-mobilizing transposase RayT
MPYWRLLYRLVWSTRGREPLISAAEEATIRRSLELTVSDLDLIPHAIGIMPNHLHVAVSIPPKIAVAEAVKRLKGASAHAVNKAAVMIPTEDGQPPATFGWQGEYGALSFGDSALRDVIDYVAHQAERHAQGRLWPKLERVGPE